MAVSHFLPQFRISARAETNHVIATKFQPGGRAEISARAETHCVIGPLQAYVYMLAGNNIFEYVRQATTSYPVENSVNSYLHTIISGPEESEGNMEEIIKRLLYESSV